jgi:hypothetical protein
MILPCSISTTDCIYSGFGIENDLKFQALDAICYLGALQKRTDHREVG